MDPDEAKICGFCDFEYDEAERCPRILPCFHSYCTHCIDVLIKNNNKNCPACHQSFTSQNPQEFSINKHILIFLKYIKDLEKRLQSPEGSSDAPHSKMDTVKDSADRIKFIMRSNTDLRIHIESMTNKVQNKILTNIQELLMRCKDVIQTLVKDHERLETQLNVIQTKNNLDDGYNMNMEIQKSKEFIRQSEQMQEQLEQTFKSMESKIAVIEEALDFTEEKAEEDKENDWRSRGASITRRKKTDIPKQPVTNSNLSSPASSNPVSHILKIKVSVQDRVQQSQFRPAVTRRRANQITLGGLKEMNGHVKDLIEKGKVFAIQDNGGKKRYAKFSIYENRHLCLHCLQEAPQVYNTNFLKFEDVMTMVDHSSKVVFLEMKNIISENTLGKIIISLLANTKKGENFFLLCTGEMGPSYTGTQILVVGDKAKSSEEVWMGEYDNTGGKAVVPGAGTEVGKELPWSAGTLGGSSDGDAMAAQFGIITGNIPGKTLKGCFGKGEGGLTVLTDALKRYSHIEDEVVIGDCGIVLKTL